MNALIIGGGGREQALAWKIAQSPLVNQVYIAPGNAGMVSDKCISLPTLKETDFENIAAFILEKTVQLLVVGPEQPLVEGIVDYFAEREGFDFLHIVGPSQKGACLESSKQFAKAFMKSNGIRTAQYGSFSSGEEAKAIEFLNSLAQLQKPFVIKADGLAAGKGVVILEDLEDAIKEVKDMLNGKFGVASNTVVIEEFLEGIECSLFILTDGDGYQILPTAKDYKRIGEGDKGLNTGGMGAISPVPFADEPFMKKVEEEIIQPTVKGLKGIPYKGFIFVGLMNVAGEPYVIEYNCRMGDPETEAVMLRIEDDLVPYLLALKDQRVKELPKIHLTEKTAMTVVMASGGYPENYQKGYIIDGLESPTSHTTFHCGTTFSGDGSILTNGGRVLAVSRLASSIQEARSITYSAVEKIHFQDCYYRKDIGLDLLEYDHQQ